MKKTIFKTLMIVLALAILATSLFAFTACNDKDKKEVITVGYTIYEPMNYEENGVLVGFDTELAKAVFEKLGYDVIFKEISWENKYVDINSGNIDCIWNGFTSNSTDTDEAGNEIPRNQSVDFSYNYMLNAQCVVIATADEAVLTDAASFAGKIGYAEAGSAGLSYAEDTFKTATINTATKQTDAIMQVRTDAADFAVVDLQLANSVIGKGDYANLKIVSGLSSDSEYYAIGFKKGSALTAQVNGALEALAADGTILKLATKYGVENSVIVDFSSQK